MANVWRKTRLYLGLGPDDEYDDLDPAERSVGPVAPLRAAPARGAVSPVGSTPTPSSPPTAPAASAGRPRPVPATKARPAAAPADEQPTVRTLPSPGSSPGSPPPVAAAAPGPATAEPDLAKARGSVVRPVPAPATAKPHLVTPTSFNHAQEVADRFKASQPVLLNLQSADKDLARRLVDFTSGLCYGLNGQMEKVASQVYLLSPANVEVSGDERRRLLERGLPE